MEEYIHRKKAISGLYSKKFIKNFRELFKPLSRALLKAGVSPNTVTVISLVLGIVTGVFLASDYLWTGLVFGLAMCFSDIVDGQLAKEFSVASPFGAVLDSTIDRLNEFIVFFSLALRYYLLGRNLWIIPCAFAFLGSFMISYIRARSEAEGFECKVGRLQRPERLTIIGVGVLLRSTGIDVAIILLAVFTPITMLHRIIHVYRQKGIKDAF